MKYAIYDALIGLWEQVYQFIPNLIGFLAILIIGYFISAFLGGLIKRAFKRLDTYTEKYGLKQWLPMSFSALLGKLVYYFIFLVFLVAAVDVLKIEAITTFLNQALLYMPNVFIAVVILALGMMIGKAIAPLIKNERLAKVANYATVVFSVMASLSQLGVGERLIEIILMGVVAGSALAFGLGAKDKFKEYIDKLEL
jgi:flagellar biosynthesis protein FliQ